MSLEYQLGRCADALFAIAAAIGGSEPTEPDTESPAKPGSFEVKILSEDDMNMLTFEVTFPPVPAGSDVVDQVFRWSINGETPTESIHGKTVKTAQIVVPQGANVLLEMVHIDDAGNDSEPSRQSFEAQDTLDPSAPGAFGAVTLISEEEVP